jgi:penicillin-binding protein 2
MRRVEAERRRVFGFQPVTLMDELNQEQVVYLGEHRKEFDGLFIERFGFKRTYHLDELAGHLVGYTGLVTADDPQAIRNLPYGPRETVGKEGVERCYEQLLHGAAGSRDIEIDRQRVFQNVIREVPPQKGTDIYLTIDKEIQARAQQLLGGRPGAVIVSCLTEKHAGEILAMASSPTFDPNRFKEMGYYASLLEDPNLPLLNRAYRHAFPPGSTFKLVTVTAALQTGVLTAGAGFTCNGYLELGRHNKRFYCHNRNGHGSLTLVQAIAESCDVAFYTIALRLEDPPQTIKRYGERFGYGTPVGIDLPGEVGGILPDAQWKREHYAGERFFEVDRAWYDGDTANYGIGQGFLTATPLQVLWSAHAVALKGVWVSPRLLYAKVADRQIVPMPADEPRLLQLSPQVLETVADGMRQAVISGTCEKLNLAQMDVCAKSGTAETGIAGEEDHAWVTGYWPRQSPSFGFVVFFQNGGSAGDTAVPTARELLVFMKDYDPLRRLVDSSAEE